MSEKKVVKKTSDRFSYEDFPEEENVGDGTRSRYDFMEFLKRRNEKQKDLKLRENRTRKWKGRAAA